jgi:glycosidase
MEHHEQGQGSGPHPASPNAGTTGTTRAIGPLWAQDAVFYHVYPLGLLGAPSRNPACDGQESVQPANGGLDALVPWLDHLAGLGFGALYIGPLFESTSHGYDTIDYFRVDRRLGDNDSLRRLVDACHARGIRVVLDAVLNHVGRDFPAFRDLQAKGRDSAYAGWFANVDFNRRSPAGDAFAYEGWAGHYDLVKLDSANPAVTGHLLAAVSAWVREFDIDGLRLDAADVLSFDFMKRLSAHCAALKPDFWLMGEVVHGDYRRWANPECLHSVTNYEAFKGLWSSLNDNNYWEIDWTLKRQFGGTAPQLGTGAGNPPAAEQGMCRGLSLYNFADNHDVDRVASTLSDPAKLELLYSLLFALPGAPSVYYGSEWGVGGKRRPGSDRELRPCLSLPAMQEREARGHSESKGLCAHLSCLIRLRARLAALRHGSYRAVHVANQQLAFWRDLDGRPAPAMSAAPGIAAPPVSGQSQELAPVLAVFNQATDALTLNLDPGNRHLEGRWLTDRLDPDCRVQVRGGRLALPMPARQARFLVLE